MCKQSEFFDRSVGLTSCLCLQILKCRRVFADSWKRIFPRQDFVLPFGWLHILQNTSEIFYPWDCVVWKNQEHTKSTCSAAFFSFFLKSCWPMRDHIGRSTGISNPAWHLPQVVPRVVQTTGSEHPQPILPNCQLCINTEPTSSIGRLIKSSRL